MDSWGLEKFIQRFVHFQIQLKLHICHCVLFVQQFCKNLLICHHRSFWKKYLLRILFVFIRFMIIFKIVWNGVPILLSNFFQSITIFPFDNILELFHSGKNCIDLESEWPSLRVTIIHVQQIIPPPYHLPLFHWLGYNSQWGQRWWK